MQPFKRLKFSQFQSLNFIYPTLNSLPLMKPENMSLHQLAYFLLGALPLLTLSTQTAVAEPLKSALTMEELGLQDTSVNQAIESVKEATTSSSFVRTLPTYAVSNAGPNRITIEGEKIVQAIFDQTQLEVQTDEVSGQIFVIPRSTAPQALFLTTDKNQTYSLTISPQKTTSQEIVLKGKSRKAENDEGNVTQLKTTQGLSSLAVERADNFPLALKNLMIAMARNELPEGFRVTNRCGEACLRQYESESYVAQVLRYQNQSLKPVTLSEKLFYEKGVLAIAIAQPFLRIGETTAVYVIRRKAS